MSTMKILAPRSKNQMQAMRPAALGAALLFCSLLFVAQPLRAQLTFGGAPVDPIDSTVEEEVEESVIGQIEEQVEEQVVESVLTFGGAAVAIIESLIEESVEEEVAENIDESVEEEIAEVVEETIEEEVAENLEESVEEIIAEVIEEDITETVEESVEDSVAETVETDIAQNIEQSIEQEVGQEVELEIAASVEGSVEGTVEREIDRLLADIESGIEVDENRIHKNQWLVMAELEVFDELAKEGYLFDKVTDLPGIGMRLAEVAAPSSFDITEARQGVIDVVGSERAKVDLNHIYTAGVVASSTGKGISPRAAITVPPGTEDMSLRIGMIDSSVDTTHPALETSRIEHRSFVPKGSELPDFHGTAIASIIVGNTPDYVGLAPNAEVFAAAVFEKDQARGEFASTVSLVRALDWLVTTGVDVINISLAGPPNRLLESALRHAAKQDVLIVAAAGNGGPIADPMYPAAYDSVIAVTAVDSDGQVFRLANRGGYLDLAAPGVDLQHAQAGGGYTSSSGTSFAVPFAATAAARIRSLEPSKDVREILNSSAQDVGPAGRDDIYGYGLLRL